MFHKDLYGLRLKKLRNLSGERQADLAAVLGVKPNQIMEMAKDHHIGKAGSDLSALQRLGGLSAGADRRAQAAGTARERRLME